MNSRFVSPLLELAAAGLVLLQLGELTAVRVPALDMLPGGDRCMIASASRPIHAHSQAVISSDLVVDPGQMTVSCGLREGRNPQWSDLRPHRAYADDPLHATWGACALAIETYLDSWRDAQLRAPFDTRRHDAARKVEVSPSGGWARVVSGWTSEPGEIVDEPVPLMVTEDMVALEIRLEVDSLDGLTAAQAEPVLLTILRRGLRTSGTSTWNDEPLPYLMRFTRYDNVTACAEEDEAGLAPTEFGPQTTDLWERDHRVVGGDSLVHGYVGEYFARQAEPLDATLARRAPPVPWPQTVRIERAGVYVVIRSERQVADERYREMSNLASEKRDARILRTTRKWGPD